MFYFIKTSDLDGRSALLLKKIIYLLEYLDYTTTHNKLINTHIKLFQVENNNLISKFSNRDKYFRIYYLGIEYDAKRKAPSKKLLMIIHPRVPSLSSFLKASIVSFELFCDILSKKHAQRDNVKQFLIRDNSLFKIEIDKIIPITTHE